MALYITPCLKELDPYDIPEQLGKNRLSMIFSRDERYAFTY